MLRSKRGLYERRLETYRRVPHADDFVGLDLKGWFFKALEKFSWKFWFHQLEFFQIIYLCILEDNPDYQSFSLMSMHLYRRKKESFYT